MLINHLDGINIHLTGVVEIRQAFNKKLHEIEEKDR